MTIATKGGQSIAKVEFTLGFDKHQVSDLTVDLGNFDADTYTWTGDATSILFTNTNGASGHIKVKQLVVTFADGSTGKLDAALAYSADEATVLLGQEPYELPTLSNPHARPVSYTSSELTVANVDAATGEVSVLAAGTTTITATAAEDDEYYESTASYTLTVKDASHEGEYITIWSEDFAEAENGQTPGELTNANATYTSQGTGTKVYTGQTYAGGESPELLVAGSGGVFAVHVNSLQGAYGELTLTFKSNKSWDTTSANNVSTTTEGVEIESVGKEDNTCTFTLTVPYGTASLDLAFTNTSSNNARVDDFKLTGVSDGSTGKLDAALAYSAEEATVQLGQEPYELPTLSNPHARPVSYTSSEPTVANVDAATGEVSVLAAGTTTITATAAEDDEYYESTASYTLTVKDASQEGEYITIWSEDFAEAENEQTPEELTNANATYTSQGTGTKVYTTQISAGGESPELLVAKSDGVFAVHVNSLQGAYGELTLSFKSNKNFDAQASSSYLVSTTTEGVEIERTSTEDKTYTFILTVPQGTASLDLAFTNTSSSNARVDDFELTGVASSASAPSFTLSQVGWGTFYTDQAFTMPEGTTGYLITEQPAETGDDFTVRLDARYPAGEAVPARTPLLVEGQPGTYTCTPLPELTDETPAENLLHGTLEDMTPADEGTDYFYKLAYDADGQNLGFYWGATDGGPFAMAAGKAWLQLSRLRHTAAALSLDSLHGGTTGIATATAAQTDGPQAFYTLDGRRVRATSPVELGPGIYVTGRQKIIVK